MASSQNFFSRLAGKARHGSPNCVGKDSGPVMEAPSATARQGSPRAIFQKWLSGGMTSTPSTGSPLLPVLPVLPVAPQGASWSRKRFPRWQQALDGKACKGGGIPLSLVVPLTWDGGNECDAHLYRGRAVRHVSCNLCKRLCNVTVKFCSSLRPPLTSMSQTTVGDSLTPIRVPPPDVPGSRSRRDGKTSPCPSSQELLGPFFIVKTPYNLTESSASLALEIRDLAPNTERELHRHGPRNGGFGREHLYNGSFRRDGLPGLQGTTCRGVLFT